jgi:hypothetical protein
VFALFRRNGGRLVALGGRRYVVSTYQRSRAVAKLTETADTGRPPADPDGQALAELVFPNL